MSDDKLSDFRALPDANSIQSCLINLQSCDQVIVILDKRYGPSLSAAGFDDVSATHLEYRHACKQRKPILFFVRDRLQADFDIWRKNRRAENVQLLWASSENRRLLDFLDEHAKLSGRNSRNNWCTTFSNSYDLKGCVERLLSPAILPQKLVDAINSNRFPNIEVKVETNTNVRAPNGVRCTSVVASIKNVGGAPAFELSMSWERNPDADDAASDALPTVLAHGQSTSMSFLYGMRGIDEEVRRVLSISYKSAIGLAVYDQFRVGFRTMGINSPSGMIWSGASLVSRKFFRTSAIELEIEEG